MRDLAVSALDRAVRRGVSYADVRAIESRHRILSTKNGKIGNLDESESTGVGIRVISDGCWGFAATDDLTRGGIDAAVTLAHEIARSGALAMKQPARLAPEDAYTAEWTSPCQIDPFSVPVGEQVGHLLEIDTELRRTAGV